MHSTEKVRDTTLNDKTALQHVTSISVMALCNQPEAFASDLGDDQPCYLYRKYHSQSIPATISHTPATHWARASTEFDMCQTPAHSVKVEIVQCGCLYDGTTSNPY